ncbi:MAG TPA: carboxypeptidase-like regulatory domain-containing protein [Gemmatimonadales bacterium]|nr:carboxypeptidase-like regulatory domain-containing protein [Gemmatimonadales bacterium]
MLLSAQSVTLRVVEDSTRQPLPGVVVRLHSGTRVLQTGLTRENGTVTLRAPSPGRYEISAARIGHEGFGPVSIDVAAASQVQVIVMPRTARMLPPIVVTSGSRCAGGPGSAAAAALWEEVRTALTANALTAREGRVTLEVVRTERDLSPDRVFLRERVVQRHVTSGQPFVAEHPDSLLVRGFVYKVGDSVHYAAPDAALLLTDAFLDGHCFTARSDGPPGARLGLAFAPVPGRDLPDVEGVLRIHEETRELRYLEFTYTRLGKEEGLGGPGGRVEFQRLDDGAWIVNDWTLSMPVVGRVQPVGQPNGPAERYRLLGWLEAGGRAAVRRAASPGLPTRAVRSTVRGTVYDSLVGAPLVGAIVSIDGESDSINASSDAAGQFVIVVPGSGPRLLRVTHEKLGVVVDSSIRDILLTPATPVDVSIFVPSVARFARTLCAGELATPAEAGIIGLVRDASGRPSEGVPIRATWFTRGPASRYDRRDLDTRSASHGIFTFCGIPSTGVTLELDGVKTSLRLERGKYTWVELARRP